MIPGYDQPYLASPAKFVERVRALNIPVLRPPHPSNNGLYSALNDIRNMACLFRSAQADIVHIHTARVEGARKATLAARLAGVPAVLRTEHNSPTAFSSQSARRLPQRLIDSLTDRIITVSEHDRWEQIQLFDRPSHKVYCSYNGVDTSKFNNQYDIRKAKIRLGFDSDIPIVGTVGRLAEQKGHTYLIDAAARVLQEFAPVVFLIVGDGALEESLKAQAASLGIAEHICFMGYQVDPMPYIQAMDFTVMSSLHEGFSLSLLEFMAMGKASVVTDHPGLVEACVDGVTGLVVTRASGPALAQSMLQLLRNPQMTHVMGRAARARVEENFTFERYTNDMMSLYDTLLAHR